MSIVVNLTAVYLRREKFVWRVIKSLKTYLMGGAQRPLFMKITLKKLKKNCLKIFVNFLGNIRTRRPESLQKRRYIQQTHHL